MNATAFIIGPLDGAGAALATLARIMDFSAVLPYQGVLAAEAQAQVTPLCFFLFAAVPNVESLRIVAEAIRFYPGRQVRFSPMIYLSDSLSADSIRACIAMGFDDVIALPLALQKLSERIMRQVGQSLTYYETPGYFGPDRRDRITGPKRAAESRLGGEFRCLNIVRDFATGVTVMAEDTHLPA